MTMIIKVKYYPKTNKIVQIKDEGVVLIGEESALVKARKQKGIDETFEENGKFIITDIPVIKEQYSVLLPDTKSEKELKEEEWNTI